MAITTLVNLPQDVLKNIFSQLPNTALLCFRLVSREGLKCIGQLKEAPYPNTTLDGERTEIKFAGTFEKMGPALFKHKVKMATLEAHPELLDVLAKARSEMLTEKYKTPFTIQTFLDYLNTFGEEGRLIHGNDDIQYTYWKPGEWLDSLPLALVPFDLCKPKLTVTYSPLGYSHAVYIEPNTNEKLPQALSAAAEKNSLDLVMLVLSHPNAKRLAHYDLENAKRHTKDNKIHLAIDNHTCDQRTYATLKKMADSNQNHAPKEYAKIFIQFSFETQKRFYTALCKKFGSPTKNVMRDGMVHFIKDPKKSLKELN